MKKIGDIYNEYKVMKNLQLHQMRVAAVAFQICESLNLEVDRDSILKACLIHDIANIIKFNLNYFPEFNKPEGLEYWEKVKYDFILKYGNDEHKASVQITRDLGLDDYIVRLVDCVDAPAIETIKIGNDFGRKICIYADNRVTPHNIVSINERNLEAKKRYENHPNSFDEAERNFFMENLTEIESQIFSHSSINPEDIDDQSIEKYLEILKDFSI